VSRPAAGSIVIVDWRGGAMPGEPNNIRPAVVVEHASRFPEAYRNIIVVPLSSDASRVISAFSERIEPTPENGCPVLSWALGHYITMASSQRMMKVTQCRITDEQLASLRRRIGLALGL